VQLLCLVYLVADDSRNLCARELDIVVVGQPSFPSQVPADAVICIRVPKELLLVRNVLSLQGNEATGS
jgi:hypothetical protein